MHIATMSRVETPETSGKRVLAIALALLSLYVIWGSTYLVMRVALETVPPFLMAGPRFLLAGVGMYAVLRMRGVKAPTREEWAASAKVGVLLLTFGNGAVAIAEQSVSSGVAAIVVGSMPIWAAFFERVARGRSGPSGHSGEWLGLLLGFVGVVLLNLGGGLALRGRGLVLLAAPMAWAAGSVWSKRLPLPAGSMATATQMIVGGLSCLLLAWVTGERLATTPSMRSILAMVYLTLAGSVIALTAYNWLLRNVRPALATSYAYVNPIVAVFIGGVFGGERIGLLTILAAAVSIAGVAIIASRRK